MTDFFLIKVWTYFLFHFPFIAMKSRLILVVLPIVCFADLVLTCKCSKEGSINNICNPKTGQCQCRQGFKGKNCNECVVSSTSFPDCQLSFKCNCNTNGTLINYKKYGPCTKESCKCKDFVTGDDCSSCKITYFNLTNANAGGCSKCGCLSAGTIGNLKLCNETTGQCLCKSSVTGRTCNKCKSGYRSLDRKNYFGCTTCNCNVGGSVSKACSENGFCKCKPNVEGIRCDRLKSGDFYMESYFHNIFEIEDAEIDGKELTFQYNNSEFLNFTGKGYVELGKNQIDVIKLVITVPATRKYQILIHYKLNQTESTTLLINATRKERNFSHHATANFQSNADPTYASVSKNQTKEFFLNAGTWVIDMDFSSFKSVFVDHLVIVPEDYYTGGSMQPDPLLPCSLKKMKTSECVMYKYIDLLPDFQHIQAKSGYNKGYGNTNASKTKTMKDFENLLQLPAIANMAVISREQITLTLEITANETDEYFMVVTYFNPDDYTHFIDVYDEETGLRGSMEASPCWYTFLCRLVVLNSDGYPLTLTFAAQKKVELTFLGNIRGRIAIDFAILIPKAVWSTDYLVPTEYCYLKNGECLQKVAFNTPEYSINIQPTEGYDVISYPVHVFGNKKFFGTVIIAEDVYMKNYILIYQYSQTKFPVFKVAVTIFDIFNISSVYDIDVVYCPSTAGCRGAVAVGNLSGHINLIMSVPDGKDYRIDFLFLVDQSEFTENLLLLKRTELNEKFQQLCLDSNNLPILKPPKGFCMDALFMLTSEFSGKIHRCNCDELGAKFSLCDKIGGQCICKEGVVGRSCNKCKKGYYGFPRCQPCNCFSLGSLTADCDRFGHCRCHQKYSGKKCNECKAGYWGFPTCKACQCDERSSFTLACRGFDGQCSCLKNFDGRQCNKCQVGYYSFPHCKICNCHAAGLVISDANPNGCSDKNPDQCICKEHVEGEDCGSCKEHYFNMTLGNPLGCEKCNCSPFGTIRGSDPCNKLTGQCVCQPNIEGRSCDSCADGWTESKSSSIFSCEPCFCSTSGSFNQVCNKKNGECNCKEQFFGLKCNQTLPGFYLPPISQFIYNGSKIVPTVPWENNGYLDGVKVNGSFATNLLKIIIPKRDLYYLMVHYALLKRKPAKVDFEFSNGQTFFSVVHILSASTYPQPHVDIIQNRTKYVKLNLTKGEWKLKVIFHDTILLNQITLAPVKHFSNYSVFQSYYNPCSIKDEQNYCAYYTYMDLFKNETSVIDAESIDPEYMLLNYTKESKTNKAILLHDTLNFSSEVHSVKEFYMIVQYVSFIKLSEIGVTVSSDLETETGHLLLPECGYTFACRQAVMLNNVTKLTFKGGNSKRHFHFKVLSGGPIYLNFVALIPVAKWSTNLIRPGFYCLKYSFKCVKVGFPLTKNMFEFEAKLSKDVSLENTFPPNVKSSNAVFLSNTQRNLRWLLTIPRSSYYIVLHFYQSNYDGFDCKVVVSTDQRAIAAKVRFDYCPSIYGCRTAIYHMDEDLVEPFYLSGNQLRLTFTLPRHATLFVERVTFVPLFEYEKNILKINPLDMSKRYLRKCGGRPDNYISESNREFCKASEFDLTIRLGIFPKPCNCHNDVIMSLSECSGYCSACKLDNLSLCEKIGQLNNTIDSLKT